MTLLNIFMFFPLELFSTDETNSKRSTPPGYGMLDCGATASAGPEASAKRLISKLRQCDPDLKVCFNYNKRPYFRYGSSGTTSTKDLCGMKLAKLFHAAGFSPEWSSKSKRS